MEAARPGEAATHVPEDRESLFGLVQRRELGLGWRRGAGGSPHKFTKQIRGNRALVSRLALEAEHTWHEGCVNTISFTPTGQRLISGSDDRHIVLGDWQTGAICARWHSGHHNNVFQAKCVPMSSERQLVSCAADGQVRVSELAEDGSATTRAVMQHRGRAHKLAVDPNSPHTILSTGEDGYVQEIDLRMGRESTELVRVSKPTARQGARRVVGLNSISLNPIDPNYFCTGGEDPVCRIWDRRKLPHNAMDQDDVCQPAYQLVPKHLQRASDNTVCGRVLITCAVYSHDGREIVASYNDELIYLLDATGASSDTGFLQKYQGHRNQRTVKGVNFMGPASEFVVSGSDCGHIFVWDKKTAEMMVMHKGDDEVVNCLEPHPCLSVLATSGIGDDVKVWAPTGEPFSDFDRAKKQALRNSRGRDRPYGISRIFFGGWPPFGSSAFMDDADQFESGDSEDDSSDDEEDGDHDEDDDGDDEEDEDDDDDEDEEDDSEDGEDDGENDDQGVVFARGHAQARESRADRHAFFRRPTEDSSDEEDGDDSDSAASGSVLQPRDSGRSERSTKRQRLVSGGVDHGAKGCDCERRGTAGEEKVRHAPDDGNNTLVCDIETLYDGMDHHQGTSHPPVVIADGAGSSVGGLSVEGKEGVEQTVEPSTRGDEEERF